MNPNSLAINNLLLILFDKMNVSKPGIILFKKITYLILTGKEKNCFAKISTLAEYAQCSEKTAKKWIDRFVTVGFFEKERSRRFCLNLNKYVYGTNNLTLTTKYQSIKSVKDKIKRTSKKVIDTVMAITDSYIGGYQSHKYYSPEIPIAQVITPTRDKPTRELTFKEKFSSDWADHIETID